MWQCGRHRVIVAPATFNLLVMVVAFTAFMVVGTGCRAPGTKRLAGNHAAWAV